jgi:predicted O-linked N-acetylglucosamine transferase (SPINDLY family)
MIEAPPVRNAADLAAHKRRVRVGILAGDYGDHPVADALRAFFRAAAAADPPRFEFTCIDTGSAAAGNRSLSSSATCPAWLRIPPSMDTGEGAAAIAALDLDVLLDTGGWTASSRIDIAPRVRAAVPVTVSWLGYPGSTGSRVVDYVVGDPVGTPVVLAGATHSERLVLMPQTTTWLATDIARVGAELTAAMGDDDGRGEFGDGGKSKTASPAAAPAAKLPTRVSCGVPATAQFVFGFAGQVLKLDARAVDAFSRIVTAVPASVLLLLMPHPNHELREVHVANVAAEFAARGIPRDRLVFLPRIIKGKHLLVLRGCVDLALDAFAYSGGATAVDMAFAGVPWVTLPSQRMATRIGASVLHAAGLGTAHGGMLVTANVTTYVRTAVDLASSPTGAAKLASMRATLDNLRRNRSGTLFDPAVYARAFMAALERIVEIRVSATSPAMHIV